MKKTFQDTEGNYYETGMYAKKGLHIRFCTFENRRVMTNRFLPLCLEPEQAEANLRAYAKRKGWQEIVYTEENV